MKAGDALQLEVDHERRSAIRQNHSATHLLHEALRQVLGDHVAQKGSLVAPDRLRFDFSHPKPITAAELEKVEDIANDIVLQNSPVTTRLMALDDATRVRRARAVRREIRRRGARRRDGQKAGGNAMGWSVELCGGTHVRRTGDIGLILGARRKRRRGRRAPRRGADRQGGAQGRSTSRFRPLKRRLQSLRCRLKTCRRVSARSWTSAGSSSASSPRPRRSWPWAAAATARRRMTARCAESAASSCWRAPSSGIEPEGPAQPGRRGQEAGRLRRRRHRRR